MRVLFIVQATTCRDRAGAAEKGIRNLLKDENFDFIIEIVQSRKEANSIRYVEHDGIMLIHIDGSLETFLGKELFGDKSIFPIAQEIILVGGDFNSTGSGFLNIAFDYLTQYLAINKKECIIKIPIDCTYQIGQDMRCANDYAIEQAAKDLVWKMMNKNISFLLSVCQNIAINHQTDEPLISVSVDRTYSRSTNRNEQSAVYV